MIKDIDRYTSHINIEEIGIEGQKKIKKGSVVIIGIGALGSVALQYLTAAGVGSIGIVDGDIIELSNLTRQTIYSEMDVGMSKVAVSKNRMMALNNDVKITPYNTYIDPKNGYDIIKNYDIIIDGTDNSKSKNIINKLSVSLRKPLIFASVNNFNAMISTFWHGHGPCYHCIFGEKNQDYKGCDEGVLAPSASIAGSLQALEAIKIITGSNNLLIGKLLLFNGTNYHMNIISIRKNPACNVCSKSGNNNISKIDYGNYFITCKMLSEWKKIDSNNIIIYDVRDKYSYSMSHIENAINVSAEEVMSGNAMVDRSKNVIIYCHNGMKSGFIAYLLREKGYSNVYSLENGFKEWKKSEL
ncbi:MAG: HesA/MoeB/ThiF family protein [Candidatus Thermoplasmatota archaeon]|jgi:adenylyltransferase/sulfurtransferase|nr:HesA/MoeB/ThiF family protein [Candidatus Thermoplasmatota archaeon]MCL5962920.1 HesA/MoeB/ThiF family protein [Candidatus Thermoplasmatota archaeon]